ncbi:MAG TPA: PaaI family thioesterase [Candidatus Krumholzibacteria bacterium]
MSNPSPAVQDFYPEGFSHCLGCGRLNTHGRQFKTRIEGDESVTRFTPNPQDTAVPGFVYGGLIAALIDCHAMATASAAAVKASGHDVGTVPSPRFVTASLKVDYMKPTPLGPALEARGRIRERSERKAIVEVTLSANGVVTAKGEVVAVAMPNTMDRS